MRNVSALLALAAISYGCDGGATIAGSSAPIVAGRRAGPSEVGATVALVQPGDTIPMCTGTLVTPDVVVTAAHCVLTETRSGDFGPPLSPSQIAVMVGAVDTTTATGDQTHAVAMVWAHEEFPASGGATTALIEEHDIAVLVLASPVGGTAPVPVLDPSRLDVELTPRRMLDIAGYGTTDVAGWEENTALHLAQVPYRERSTYEIIAGDPGGADTCYGDSGGPLYVATPEGMRLVGVTSRGTDPSIETCDIGTVFTLAPAYLDMLRDVTGEDLGGGATDPTPPPPEPGEDPAEDPPPPPPPAGADAGAFVPPADPGAAPPPARGATGGCSCDVAPAADAAPTPSRMFALYFLVLVVRGVTRLRRR